MYEDYLETFVFKTAKTIAMKLFGKIRKSRREDEQKESEAEPTPSAPSEQTPPATSEPSTSATSSEPSTSAAADSKDDDSKDEDKQLVESNQDQPSEKEDEETEKMLEDAMSKQREEKLKRDKELAIARVEYDAISEGLSEINFHLPLFFLLLMMAMLGAPSTVTWAKNYHFSRVLTPDPMLVPAVCVLAALGIIWQMPTPRNL